MNSRRLLLAIVAVFIATFATDYLIHGLWLESAYTKTIELWRSDPEILLNTPWLMGGQLLAAIVMVGIWAMAFAEGAGLRRACLFGLVVGLLRQIDTLTDFAVQPIPASLALKWFVSGIAQSVLLALIAFAVYKPKSSSGISPAEKVASERRWLTAAIVVTLILAGSLFWRSKTRDLLADTAAYAAPSATAFSQESGPMPTNAESLFFAMDTTDGRGTPEAKAAFLKDLDRLDAQVRERSRMFEPELLPLLDTIIKRQVKGKNTAYSLQIFREIRWWEFFTTDTNATRARIDELKKSLEDGRNQSFAQEQLPDGSWGPGYTLWFMKLYGTIHDGLSVEKKQKYPLTFLDRINSPEKLTNYLQSIVVDNNFTTGVLNRMEADEAVSNLGRLILRDVECDYAFHPQLKDAYLEFIDRWQNPETGCWGNWYVARDGSRWRCDDVGMTFHIVSLLEDKTRHLDKIARRVLHLSTFDFPMGIRMNGRYENHLNWDAVVVWGHAWPHLDKAARADISEEISRMLDWSLAESLQPDGSFKISELDNTFGDAMDFGVLFLRDVGFFQKKKRFWTQESFPQAKEIHQRIKARLEASGYLTPELERTYRKMKAIEPD